jgi:hypothetical protein
MPALSLLDIAPRIETVSIGGDDTVEVRGVSAKSIAMLLGRFPELARLVSGVAPTPEQWKEVGPAALNAIVACALGYPGDREAELRVENLSLEATMDILTMCGRLTFPGGVGPFVQRLVALTPMVPTQPERRTRGQDTESLTPSNGLSKSEESQEKTAGV